MRHTIPFVLLMLVLAVVTTVKARAMARIYRSVLSSLGLPEWAVAYWSDEDARRRGGQIAIVVSSVLLLIGVIDLLKNL
jgi:hypothetical protein